MGEKTGNDRPLSRQELQQDLFGTYRDQKISLNLAILRFQEIDQQMMANAGAEMVQRLVSLHRINKPKKSKEQWLLLADLSVGTISRNKSK
jgi:hypothetical protein